MAVFFDLLVFDEHVLLNETYADRTYLLSKIIHVEPGRAILADRFHLNLKPLESAINSLQCAFAQAIAQRKEGYVIKPANSPYLGNHNWIKLKKDYIPGLGDTLDFCIVGAGFDSKRAKSAGKLLHGMKWNVLHVGCLENKDGVVQRVSLLRAILT